MDILYENIRRMRQIRGYSLDELAEKTGYGSRSMMSKVELGKVDIPISKLRLIAKALNVRPSVLMGVEDSDELS